MRLLALRPLLRAATLALCVLVVLGLAASLALRIVGRIRLARAEEAMRRQGLSLDLGSYAPPPVPRGENAAVYFQAGSAATLLNTQDRTLLRSLWRHPSPEWSEEQVRKVRAALDANHGALEMLHRGVT